MGKLAVVTNVGTLVEPLTKVQYQNSLFKKPYQLFSHSDQVTQSQTSISNTEAFTGWGGRVSDNMTAGQNPNGLIPMITSISGAQLFTAGQTTLPLAIANAGTSLAGVLNPAGFSGSAASVARLNAFNALRAQDLSSNYVAAASHVTDLAMQANGALQTFQEVTVTFPNTSIGNQLKQVARLIKKRTDLNVNRQIFYVQIGGFDHHENELTGQVSLFSQFSQAMRSFYDEMVTQGVSNDVTTFTLSDFGRTFTPAGTGTGVGTDHAWGNHMFVMGGSVLGGDFYGSLRPDGTGNLLPEPDRRRHRRHYKPRHKRSRTLDTDNIGRSICRCPCKMVRAAAGLADRERDLPKSRQLPRNTLTARLFAVIADLSWQ